MPTATKRAIDPPSISVLLGARCVESPHLRTLHFFTLNQSTPVALFTDQDESILLSTDIRLFRCRVPFPVQSHVAPGLPTRSTSFLQGHQRKSLMSVESKIDSS